MKKGSMVCVILALAFGMTACGSREYDKTDGRETEAAVEEMEFKALITKADPKGKWIEVCGFPDNDVNHRNEFFCPVDEDTALKNTDTDEVLKIEDLKEGDCVQIAYDGDVLEVYPCTITHVMQIGVCTEDKAVKEACIQHYKDLGGGNDTPPDPSERPVMQITYTESGQSCAAGLTQGGYHWSWTDEDGQRQEELADTAFIAEWPKLTEIHLDSQDTEIELLPGGEPDVITAACWSESVKEMEFAPEGEDAAVEKRDGKWYLTEWKRGYYYLVHVNYGKDYVEYGFLIGNE